MARPNWEYIRVDVLLPGNPKLDGLTYTSRWTLIELWCHCGQFLTDGFVRDAVWRRLGTANARRQLVERGLAHRVAGGYQMHDYLEHQRSRAEVEDLKEKRRKAGAKGGNAKANAKQVLEQTLEQEPKQTASKPVAEAEAEIYGVGAVTDPVRSSPPPKIIFKGASQPRRGGGSTPPIGQTTPPGARRRRRQRQASRRRHHRPSRCQSAPGHQPAGGAVTEVCPIVSHGLRHPPPEPRTMCGQPAAVPVEFGCVHEHIGSGVICEFHAKKLLEYRALRCPSCWRAGHTCIVLGRELAQP